MNKGENKPTEITVTIKENEKLTNAIYLVFGIFFALIVPIVGLILGFVGLGAKRKYSMLITVISALMLVLTTAFVIILKVINS